jgi:hypothetical protein
VPDDDDLPPVLGEKYRDALAELMHEQADQAGDE